jgi:DNA-binding MarR family transcriptional regulator
VLIAWALWSAGAFKAWRNNKTKTNMNDAQLKLSSQICFLFRFRLITKAYKPYLDEMGITYPQYLVLLVLWENDGLYVNQITELLLSTNTLSPLLKRMEKMEFYNARSIEDERSVIVQLTEKEAKEQSKPTPFLKN